MSKTKTIVSLGISIIFSINNLVSQDVFCGFETFLAQRISQDSQIYERINVIHNDVLLRSQEQDRIRSRDIKTIPVVVHVVWKQEEDNISTERILDQIEMLNEVFSNRHADLDDVPVEFKGVIGNPALNFCLAVNDPDGNPTSGILRVKTHIDKIGATDNLFFSELGGSTAWDTDKYLNIWITGYFGSTGYAFPPGYGDSSRDGIVLLARIVDVGNTEIRNGNGRVCVHEIGHYFGLSHIWGNDERLDTACLVDDGLSDTPPQFRATFECPDEIHPAPFSCGNNNMYVNFMDYSPDQCLSMFTRHQVDYMLDVLELYRPGLINNNIDCFNFTQKADELSFNINPNPANNEVKVSFDPVVSVFSKIEIYDLNGILLWTYEDLLFNGIEITLPEFQPGFYIVKIGKETQKLIII
jgi:hypothetical protein